jgi:aspartyl-tRNA(Asn)/glutamyl-tRNA(Gln) amidotransferase subunit A
MLAPREIAKTQKDLSDKNYSVVELVSCYLRRIKKYDKDLNSLNTLNEKGALVAAKAQDKLISEKGKSAFQEKPLLGVTVLHKDLFLTKNLRTTASSNVLKNYIPQYSATVVNKLEKAGCITLGKTNCDAWAHGASGENSDFGPTKNPWNKKYVPGGSSSGSASSLAAEFSLLTTGTDTGGSIRQPASFCSLVGFKPTYGAVSRYGIIAMASSLDSIGHFTHTVADSKTIFNITKGTDMKDSTLKQDSVGKKGKFTIGIPKEYFVKGLENSVSERVNDAIKKLQDLGIKFVDISLPHTKYGISVYYIIQPAEVSSNLGRYDGIRYGNDRSSFGDEATRRIMLGTFVLSAGYYDAYYLKAMKVRSKIITDFDNAFFKVDAIIAPVSPTPPFKLGEKTQNPLSMYLADVFTVNANIAGIPAVSLPCGFTDKGLPVGFQLMGPRFGEESLFNIGRIYQNNTDYHERKPTL